jgi:hypothetical protein
MLSKYHLACYIINIYNVFGYKKNEKKTIYTGITKQA